MDFRFVRAYPPAAPSPGPAIHLWFRKNELLLGPSRFMPGDNPVSGEIETLYLGTLEGAPCVAGELADDAPIPGGFELVGLRALYGQVGEAQYALAGYALQLLHWRGISGFCPRCGSTTQSLAGGWACECVVCGHTMYPPVSPAVLALVHDGSDRVLLAQKDGWANRWSILAGFVEPGESLEDCVVREVSEEVGLRVGLPVYDGSQPWPFPHQVMVGFTAEYLSGEIVLEEAELSRAEWFRFDALPELPPPLSLSRQIIDRWVQSRQGTPQSRQGPPAPR